MPTFNEIPLQEIPFSPFDIKDQWMLVTAEQEGKINTMTASWGGWGIMWNKEVAFVVIRPTRYTHQFIQSAPSFSLSFFDAHYKKELAYLGRVSGRDEDKIAQMNLSTDFCEGAPYITQAAWFMVVRKLFAQPMLASSFVDRELIDTWYPLRDFHTLYIAAIEKVMLADTSVSG